MSGRFFLHAPNVHCGGGLTLLLALIDSLPEGACLIVDDRLPVPKELLERFDVYRIIPTIFSRFKAELLLHRLAKSDDEVLCFGNLPPLFSLEAKVKLFIQNRYLVDSLDKLDIPVKLRVRLQLERWWFKRCQRNVEQIIVQTISMKALVSQVATAKVVIAPFVSNPDVMPLQYEKSYKKYDFVYIASGEAHKNHLQLIKAWRLLAEEGFFPSLVLTLEQARFPELCEFLETEKSEFNLNIQNKGDMPHKEVQELYKESKALIYPSVFESFGLPLIEASRYGLGIIASELDYVRDVVEPEQTFDPASARSITRSIKRYLKIREQDTVLFDAKSFLGSLWSTGTGDGDSNSNTPAP